MKSCITSFLKNFAVCLSGQISIFLHISCPLSFSLSPALLTPYLSFLYSSPSLIYSPGSFHPSARPSISLSGAVSCSCRVPPGSSILPASLYLALVQQTRTPTCKQTHHKHKAICRHTHSMFPSFLNTQIILLQTHNNLQRTLSRP